jgi:hypothetical protein
MSAPRRADADHRGAKARVLVEEVPVAPALAVAVAADQPVLVQQADRVRDGRRADLQVLGQFGGGAAAGLGGEQAGHHAGGGARHAGLDECRGELGHERGRRVGWVVARWARSAR